MKMWGSAHRGVRPSAWAWPAVLAILLTTLPSSAAPRGGGDLWFDGTSRIAADEALLKWRFREGSGVRRTDRVRVQLLERGRWQYATPPVALAAGKYKWDTSDVNPGQALRRHIRLVNQRSGRTSSPIWIWIDHTPPTVRITSPRAERLPVPVAGDSMTPMAVAVGETKLEVDGHDTPSGELAYWEWEIIGPVFGTRSWRESFNFGAVPGVYDVRVLAYDDAGNQAWSAPIKVIGVPDPADPLQPPVTVRLPGP